jgi:hypothetical protein
MRNDYAAASLSYALLDNDPLNLTDILGLTVHLWPFNGEVENRSRYASVTVLGDYQVVFNLYKDLHVEVYYPWSEFESGPPGGFVLKVARIDFTDTFVLGPRKTMREEWNYGSTRIVDSDFIVGASVKIYSNACCTTEAKLPVKIGWRTLYIHDCYWTNSDKEDYGVYYSFSE